MLQQTRVGGRSLLRCDVRWFPAPLRFGEEVLKVWENLSYARVRQLLKAAKIVVDTYAG